MIKDMEPEKKFIFSWIKSLPDASLIRIYKERLTWSEDHPQNAPYIMEMLKNEIEKRKIDEI